MLFSKSFSLAYPYFYSLDEGNTGGKIDAETAPRKMDSWKGLERLRPA